MRTLVLFRVNYESDKVYAYAVDDDRQSLQEVVEAMESLGWMDGQTVQLVAKNDPLGKRLASQLRVNRTNRMRD